MGNCKFNKDWVAKFPWLWPVDSDVTRGWCILCKKSISIRKGACDVHKHGTSMLHVNKSETQTNSEAGPAVLANRPNAIAAAMQRNQALSQYQRKTKDAALKFEFSLTVRAANHNISGKFLECVVDLVKTQ